MEPYKAKMLPIPYKLDKETIKLMLQALTPEELKLAREKYLKEDENRKRHKISLQLID